MTSNMRIGCTAPFKVNPEWVVKHWQANLAGQLINNQ